MHAKSCRPFMLNVPFLLMLIMCHYELPLYVVHMVAFITACVLEFIHVCRCIYLLLHV